MSGCVHEFLPRTRHFTLDFFLGYRSKLLGGCRDLTSTFRQPQRHEWEPGLNLKEQHQLDADASLEMIEGYPHVITNLQV
jgi:hypothetical protein